MNGEKLLSPAGRCEDRRFVVGAGRHRSSTAEMVHNTKPPNALWQEFGIIPERQDMAQNLRVLYKIIHGAIPAPTEYRPHAPVGGRSVIGKSFFLDGMI